MLMAIHTRHSPGQIAKGYTPQKFDQDQSPWRFLRQKFSTLFEKDAQKMPQTPTSPNGHGPAIRALDPWVSSGGRMRQLLTDGQRADLAVMSSVVRFKKGEIIYQEGDPANAVFNLNTGVVTAFKQAPDNSEHVVAFLLADDLFGLSAEGQYTNSTRALTAVTAYRLPVTALRSRLTKDAELEFHVMCKLCQELRQAQRHAFLLSQRSAVTKLAMFLQLFEQAQIAKDESTSEIHLPMDRSDIGEYISVTLAAVSRAFRTLTTRGIIEVRDRHHVRIVDRSGFEKIAGDPPPPAMQFAMQSTID
jgi:CRP/FNR family transcriptional regulator, anaerobic regulatory protein